MPGPISRKSWLDIREAADLVGKHILGEQWSIKILDYDVEDRTIRDIRSDLHRAFSSGEVRAQIFDGRTVHTLKPEEANHPCFGINIRDNCISLGDPPGPPWDCDVHTNDLEAFLKKYAHTRHGNTSAAQREQSCRNWLLGIMRKDQRRPKADLRQTAINRFSISQRAFDKIWTESIRSTRCNWNKPGRPKSAR
jgi:hypothetical protein